MYTSEKSLVSSAAVLYLLLFFMVCNLSIAIRDDLYIQETTERTEYKIEQISNSTSEPNRGIYHTRASEIYETIEEMEDSQEQINEEIRLGEIELLAQLVEAEAGNQDFKGKCLVADVVLNRVRSDRFPNNIEDVIFQSGGFSCVDDGGFKKAGWNISEESFEAARQEYENYKIDSEILFFTAGRYNPYCIPMYKYGAYYFGK